MTSGGHTPFGLLGYPLPLNSSTYHNPDMHTLIIHNNKVSDARRACVPPISSAMLYGHGVFTTLAIYGGRPFLWPQHWARLTEHAGRTQVDYSTFNEASVGASLANIIEANKVENGRARVTLLMRQGYGMWKVAGVQGRNTDLLITTGELHETPDDGVALTISPYRVNTFSPLCGIKSTNHLLHILSWEEARARQFQEAVMLNERGEIVSATLANIFWMSAGVLHTPSLSTGAINGTTRACVIALAGEMAVPCIEGVYELSHLASAAEIFLTSAGLGVAIVKMFDFHRYTVPVGSETLRLREALRQLMRQPQNSSLASG